MNLRNKRIVLTGATGGIGREIAKALDSRGAELTLIAKSESQLQNLRSSLAGPGHSYYVCDLISTLLTEKIAKQISSHFEKIDVLINSAGIGIYKPIEELTIDNWSDSMNINVNAPFIFTKLLIENLKRAEKGVVINLGSGNGEIAVPGRSAYCTSKFALRGMSLSLAAEFRGSNVDICLMTLGSVLTSFGPMTMEEKKRDMEDGKGYLAPDWVGEKVVEILESDSREPEYKIYPSGYELQN